jgi:hypothetical protein
VNNAKIESGNRKTRNRVFRAIQDGYFDEAKPVSASTSELLHVS